MFCITVSPSLQSIKFAVFKWKSQCRFRSLIGVAKWYILKERKNERTKRSLSVHWINVCVGNVRCAHILKITLSSRDRERERARVRNTRFQFLKRATTPMLWNRHTISENEEREKEERNEVRGVQSASEGEWVRSEYGTVRSFDWYIRTVKPVNSENWK